MIILLIAGLMGSGKSTIMSSLTRTLSEQSALRVSALILGEISPGKEFSLSPGAEIHEMVGSCVNCYIGWNMIKMLDEIRNQERSDIILVELSSTTTPGTIRDYLENSKQFKDDSIIAMTVVDMGSTNRLHESLDYLFEAMVYEADIVVLNRSDLCSLREKDAFVNRLQTLKASLKIIPATSSQPIDIRSIIECRVS